MSVVPKSSECIASCFIPFPYSNLLTTISVTLPTIRVLTLGVAAIKKQTNASSPYMVLSPFLSPLFRHRFSNPLIRHTSLSPPVFARARAMYLCPLSPLFLILWWWSNIVRVFEHGQSLQPQTRRFHFFMPELPWLNQLRIVPDLLPAVLVHDRVFNRDLGAINPLQCLKEFHGLRVSCPPFAPILHILMWSFWYCRKPPYAGIGVVGAWRVCYDHIP